MIEGEESADKRANIVSNTNCETDAVLVTLHMLSSLIFTTALGDLMRSRSFSRHPENLAGVNFK